MLINNKKFLIQERRDCLALCASLMYDKLLEVNEAAEKQPELLRLADELKYKFEVLVELRKELDQTIQELITSDV